MLLLAKLILSKIHFTLSELFDVCAASCMTTEEKNEGEAMSVDSDIPTVGDEVDISCEDSNTAPSTCADVLNSTNLGEYSQPDTFALEFGNPK